MDKKGCISLICFLILLISGLIIFCYPMIANPDNMPGDLIDARLIHYILEHGWLWFNKIGINCSFWDMPFYYPHSNTLSFSDVMLGGMFFYIPLRLFIENPQTALQIWVVVMCILNFLSMYLFLKKVCNIKPLYASCGAFLFAFCLPRQYQTLHLQILPQFYMMFSLLAFFSIKKTNSLKKNNFYFLTGSIILFVWKEKIQIL